MAHADSAKNIRKIIWTGEYFAAVGDGGVVVTSVDGETWNFHGTVTRDRLWRIAWTTRFTTNSGSCSYAMAWSGSRIVAVGDSGSIVTSSDGVTWTQRSAGSMHYRLYGIASGVYCLSVCSESVRCAKLFMVP